MHCHLPVNVLCMLMNVDIMKATLPCTLMMWTAFLRAHLLPPGLSE